LFKLTNTKNPTKVALSASEKIMLQSLRKAGGPLVMTIPKAFVEQNRLFDGAQVTLHLSGTTLSVEAPNPPRYRLAELMAEMPDGLPRVDRWEALTAVGLEQD
jgi:antitoxin ChpS